MAPPQGLKLYIVIYIGKCFKKIFSRTAAQNRTIFSMEHP